MKSTTSRIRSFCSALTPIVATWLLTAPASAVVIDNFPAVQPVAVIGGDVTHMTQLPDEHVTLVMFANGKGETCNESLTGSHLNFFRIDPDGALIGFDVPKGKLLVVTDFNATAHIPKRIAETGTVRTTLRLGKKGLTGGEIAYRSDFHLTSDLDTMNFTTGDKLPSGILVSSVGALCPQMKLDDASNDGLELTVTSGNYRGYLIDDGSNRRAIADDR